MTTRAQLKLIEGSLEIQENEPDELAFMARQLVQVTLPHSNPGQNTHLWSRTNGHLTLSIQPHWTLDKNTGEPKSLGIPYGTIPRLLLFWITTEAVRTKNRKLILGDSLSGFMRQLNLIPSGGRWGTIPRLKDQMNRLFRSKISFDGSETQDEIDHDFWEDRQIAPKGELWWSNKNPEQGTLFPSWIELGEYFYNTIITSPVPVDIRALRLLKRSPLALDLYAWTTFKTFSVTKRGKADFIPWRGLMKQLGADYDDLGNFRKKVKSVLRKIQIVYPALKLEDVEGGFKIHPSRTAIQSRKTKIC